MGLNEFAGYIAVAGAAGDGMGAAQQQGLRLSHSTWAYCSSFSVWVCPYFWFVRRNHTSPWNRVFTAGRVSPDLGCDLLAHDDRGSQPLEHQPGRARQQPERRHGVGPVSLVLCGREHESGADRRAAIHPALGVSCNLERARSRTGLDASG